MSSAYSYFGLDDPNEKRKSSKTSSPYSYFGLKEPEQKTSQVSVPSPIVSPEPIKQPKKPSAWDMLKVGDVKGLANEIGIGLRHGAAETGSAKMDEAVASVLSKSTLPSVQKYGQQQLAGQQTEQNYLRANPVNSVPAMLGKELFMLPAWVGGERLVGAAAQGIGKLAPSVAAKVEKIPNFVKGGLKDTAIYGSVVAPIEVIREGGGLQTLAEKEKNLPSVFLGGTALRGIGAGAKQALALRKANLDPAIKPISPLEEAQNTYRSPVNEMKLLPSGQDFTMRDVTTADRIKQMGVTNEQSLLPPGRIQPIKGQQALPPAQGFTVAEPYVAKAQIPKTEFEKISSNYPQTIFSGKEYYRPSDFPSKEAANRFAELEPSFKESATWDNATFDNVANAMKGEKAATYDAMVNYLRTSGGKGVEQGGIFTDEFGDTVGRYGRVSNNPKWYRDFYAENGRKPSSKEIDDLAEKFLREGFDDDAVGTIPPDETYLTLTNDIEKLDFIKSIRDYKGKQPESIKDSSPRLSLPPGQDFVLQGEPYRPGIQIPKTDFDATPTPSTGFKTQIPKTDFDKTPIPPSGFKQTIEVPRYYDNSSQGLSPSMSGEKVKVATTIPQDTKVFWRSVGEELTSKGELHPISMELLKREIKEGKVNISGLSNEEEVATLLGMDLTKFGKNAKPVYETPLVGLPKSQSEIVIGKKKDKLGFKDSLKRFYTKVVNVQQPFVDVGKVDGSDIGILASNSRNVSGIVDYNFLKGMVNKNGDKVGESLQSVVEAIPKGKEKDFWSYMSHRHNIDRAREGKPVQANYTPEMSAKAVKQFEVVNPAYKDIGDNIVRWLDDFMQTWGVDTGIVNKEVYKGLRETYKNYFPTQREFSELEKSIPDNLSQKFADQRTPIRKATGSGRDIKDPTENIMNLVNRTIRTAKYNEVGQTLLKSVRTNPEKLKPFAEEIPVKEGMFANTDNVISVLEDGKAVYLRINDKPLLDAMEGLPKSVGNVPYVTALTNGIKNLITQKNPLFALRNIARDIPTAYVYGSEKNPIKFTAGLVGAGKDIITQGPRLQKYKAVGGGGANFFSSGDVAKSAAEITGRVNPIKKLALKPIKGIEAFNNLTESAPRLAEFNRVFKRTGDVNKALYAANEVTVNFSRGGNIAKTIDKAGGMYINASIQGLDRFFRGFKDPKTAVATLAKAGIAISVPDVALYMINRDNPNYQQLDNRSKDAYFQIPNYGNVDEKGNPKTFIKIPKSRELGVLFGSLFERIERSMAGQKDSFKGFGKSVATNFAPANPLENSLYTPLLISVPRNKDFADRPIIPQSMIMDKRSPYLQYDDKSTEPAKWFANLIKDVPMPEKVKSVVGSPKVIDYLVKSYTGVVGQLGIPLATPGGSIPKALKTQFTSDPVFSNQASTNFYDRLNKLSATATDKNLTENIPSKKLTKEENIKNSMQGVSSAISRGTKQINKIQSSGGPNKEDEIVAIRKQILELMLSANSADDAKAMQKVENRANKVFKK